MKATTTMYKIVLMAVCAMIALAGCQADSRDQLFATSTSQVQLRSFQTRAFDTTDSEKTLRTVIATLQDLGFVVDKADLDLGTVSATKLDGYLLRITVSVRPRGETQLLVRANANYQQQAVEEAGPYQQFFTALGKAMFLEAQEVS